MNPYREKYKDVFSIPVKGANGEEMFLEQFRGKVVMFVNTTGHCGNTSQWPILDELQKEYAEKPFQIVYVPTNDFCGSVTFGKYKKGIENGKESEDYAKETFNIEAPFTELLSSRNEPWAEKVGNLDTDTAVWTVDQKEVEELTQAPRSDLFNYLIHDPNKEILGGNFHKILVNKAGIPMVHIGNDVLNEGAGMKVLKIVDSRETELNNIRRVIDKLIETDSFTYENLSNSWTLA